jgi:hypothetical protein
MRTMMASNTSRKVAHARMWDARGFCHFEVAIDVWQGHD